MDYKHTCDTIFTHFQGITTGNNIYGFGFFCSFIFLPIHQYFYPSLFVFTHPNDGGMGLYIKLWSQACVLTDHTVLVTVSLTGCH